MFHVYILTNRKRGTLYTGVTNDLVVRVALHRSGQGSNLATSSVPAGRRSDLRNCRGSHRAGKAAEEMAAFMEDPADRSGQP